MDALQEAKNLVQNVSFREDSWASNESIFVQLAIANALIALVERLDAMTSTINAELENPTKALRVDNFGL